MLDIIAEADAHKNIPSEGIVIQDNWTEEEFVATDSPMTINNAHAGHVYMFAQTSYVERVVEQLAKQFFITGIITIILTIMTIFLLTRFIAQPLIKMKQATEQLSKGNNKVSLNTERKDELGDLAKSVNKLAADLSKLKVERNEFLASIAHELRTPLTYIQGYADIINRKDTTEEEKAEYTKIIREETEKLTLLVKDLFELARMDEHNFKVYPEWLNAVHLIKQIIERMTPVFKEKRIDVKVSCPDELTLYADKERIQQVLVNILDNAQKHAQANSTITVVVRKTAEQVIDRKSTRLNSSHVAISYAVFCLKK